MNKVKRKVTIEEIARMAGVSKTTVSRVINKKPDVNPQTRKKILDLITVHDFQPNVFAKAISLQKSYNISLLIPHAADYIFSNQFYVEVLRGVSTYVDQTGYFLLICYPHDQNFVDMYKQQKVDGFIVISPGTFQHNIIQALERINAPFVSTAMMHGEENMIYVDVDNVHGAILATEHLISLNHKRIAFVGKPVLTSSLDRLNGYRITLNKHHIEVDPELIRISETSSINSGYAEVKQLMQLEKRPTAVFLANDVMAIGAIKAIEEVGLRVPEDVSVVGFDDIQLAQYASPQLTTIRQPAYEKGVRAAEMLIEYLENNKEPKTVIMDVELVVRDSTALCAEL